MHTTFCVWILFNESIILVFDENVFVAVCRASFFDISHFVQIIWYVGTTTIHYEETDVYFVPV